MQASGSDGRGSVVVTGASTGIGQACAQHLDGIGFRVFAGIRRPEDGERLRAEASERLTPLSIDVTDPASIEAATRAVGERLGDGGLAGLVNNAGIVVPGPLEFVPIDDLRRQFEVNVLGQMAVTQAFLPSIRRAQGRIVNIGSIGGRIATAFNGPYGASKHAMEAVSDALRQELAPWGIHVALIEPGATATEIWRKGDENAETDVAKLGPEGRRLYEARVRAFAELARRTGARGIPPERVAERVEHALTARRPRTRYVVGRDARAMALARTVLPDRALDRLVARELGKAG